MDEKLDRKMDEQLETRVAELTANNDETGDGKLDAADLKAQLNRIVAVFFGGLLLRDDAGACLDDSYRNDLAALIENLGHAHFFADDRFLHFHVISS